MKKSIYLLIILSIFTLSGCSKKPQMADFIPTQAPEQITQPAQEDTQGEEAQVTQEATPTPRDVVIGKTTPMYVKLDEYGAFLNVRSTPSTKGEPVGFLVHAEQIDVIEIADGWASFLYNGTVCYVNADYLVKERPEYLTPPTPTPVPVNTPTPKPENTPTVKPDI